MLILEQLLFFASIILVLFVPGIFLMLAIWGKSKIFSDLERFLISFGLSIVSINFLIILIGRIGIPINIFSVLTIIILFSTACFGIYKKRFAHKFQEGEINNLFFSRNQIILIILILFLTIFIKTIYLSDAIFPTSTDLGHHMYWSKQISETGELPTYEKRKIVEVGENYQLSDPDPIDDFIIGEHLVFSAINLISRIDFISYFPSLVLYLINMMGILAIFVLALKLFENCDHGKNIAIFSLFLMGPLYAISSAQAKFVSGGVIGNTIGNLLIPLALYFYLLALRKKDSWLLATAIFITAGLFYAHHLSAFIFLYILAFTLASFVAFNIKNILPYLRNWMKMIFSPPVISVLIFFIIFLVLIYTPSYIKSSAVDTAIGGPSKATRAGLTFTQLKFAAGEARMALGIVGLILLFAIRTRKTYSSAIMIGWTVALLAMSLRPAWLYLDIPSGRIANYIAFPLSIVGAFAFVWILSQIRNAKMCNYYLNARMLYVLFAIILTYTAYSGLYDNAHSLSEKPNYEKAIQTFHASRYLETVVGPEDVVLKDHNYITADAWIKLFFMRDYSYPLSRGFFKRYEDETKKREMCTLWMISTPNTDNGTNCFSGTGTKFIMVNPKYDGPQFEKSKTFWKAYSGPEISIYYKNL